MKTEKQIKVLTKQMENIAGERVKIEDIKGTVYIFGTELATLRILKKFRDSTNVRHGYSKNLETYYVSIENRY